VLKLFAFAATAATAWLVFPHRAASFRVRAFAAFWWNPAMLRGCT